MRTFAVSRPLFLVLTASLLAALPGCDLLGDERNGPRLEGLPGKVLYVAKRGGEQHNIYVTDQKGTRQLTDVDETSFIAGPSWSPDGKRIAYSDGTGATTLGPYLKLMNADGSGKRFLKEFEQESPQAMVGWTPVWSPDGKWISFDVCTNCEIGGRNYELSVVRANGETYDSKDHYALASHPASDHASAWSPDGEQVAFTSNRAYFQTNDPRRYDLYIINADSTGLRRLTETGVVGSHVWSPDGEWIAIGPGDEALLLLDPQSGNTRRVPMDLPSGFRAHPVDWPLPSALLMNAYKDGSPDENGFYVLDTETGELKEVLSELGRIGRSADWHAGN